MANPLDICSLDYLTGTIATAYKGVITSLVARDFCMTGEDATVTLRGTVLSMPPGDYTAALVHEGQELARTRLREGEFRLSVAAETVAGAANLQIDILQYGRHIGTFLLKRQRQGEFYASAMEISEDLRGIDLRLLTARLHDKPGLLQKAEDIISRILSTKKDWGKFSEAINSFAADLFWYERETFGKAYPVLVRFSARSAENANEKSKGKAVANLLQLISLPLEKPEKGDDLRFLAEAWLKEVSTALPDFSLNSADAIRIMRSLREKFPDIDILPLLRPLLANLKKRITEAASIPAVVLSALKEAGTGGEPAEPGRYGNARKEEALGEISEMETLAEANRSDELLDRLEGFDAGLSDDTAMIDSFFVFVRDRLTGESAPLFSEAVSLMFSVFPSLSARARQQAIQHVAGLLRQLITIGISGSAEALLIKIGEAGLQLREEMLLADGAGKAVLSSGNPKLLEHYKEMLKQVLIPGPGIAGFSSETWAEQANPLHLERLSRFMEIIGTDTEAFRDVLVHVVCNLYIGGVFIPDDRLFQRQVSSYLNAGTFGQNFLLNCLLLAKLPVYYSEVGATGRLRDFTTGIDAWGNDTVLYFLRKQVHVNASNFNVPLVERIITSWLQNDPAILRGSVPDDVIDKMDRELLGKYAAAIRPFLESAGVLAGGEMHLDRLAGLPEERMRELLRRQETTEEISSKILLLCRTYQEIIAKYSFAPADGAETDDTAGKAQKLAAPLETARRLKDILVSPEKTRAEESLYYKRHIAFGIPSVMGSYREPKFNAFGDLLRTEEEFRILLEDIASSIGSDFSEDDLREWISSILLVKDLFDLHGLSNFQVDELAAIFRTNALRLSQVADMLRLWQRELTWIVDFFYRTFHKPLMNILGLFPRDDMTEHLRRLDFHEKDFAEKAADVVIRDIMSGVPGLLELDGLLNSLLPVLNAQISAGRDKEFSMNARRTAGKEFFSLEELEDRAVMELSPLLGSKAKNLMYLRNRGLPVPAGAVFAAGKTERHEDFIQSKEFYMSLRKAVSRLETRTGAVFGGGKNPLLLSVRSGSYISMPGILSSVLYCGLNSETVGALIEGTGDAAMAWDSRRRFIEHFATVALGMKEGFFEDVLSDFMGRTGKKKREELDAEELERLVGFYEKMLKAKGMEIPEDVYEQLRLSVRGVYGSWYSEKARQFRKAMSVSKHWGTAVTIMEMIRANAQGSGASVFFTRRPLTMEKGIYGETRESATGDDLVYGRLTNRPLSRLQEMEGQKSLEETDPDLFLLHRDLAERIEAAMRGLPQEVEATYVRRPEGKRIMYVLQTRRMEFHRGFTRRFQDVCRMESSIIGRGIGVHGGALSGTAVLSSSLERIGMIRGESDLPLVLLRRSASTEDVSLMSSIDAIITSAGGATSHAAVLAQKFDLTAVVGCADMTIGDERGGPFAVIGGHVVREGDPISLDGSTGLVYSGVCAFTEQSPSL